MYDMVSTCWNAECRIAYCIIKISNRTARRWRLAGVSQIRDTAEITTINSIDSSDTHVERYLSRIICESIVKIEEKN